jgi:TonB-linked SusC/RagA family outer membrane protein
MYKVLPQKLWAPYGLMAKILLIMRLTTIILLAAIIQVSANSFAQKITLSENNTPLVKVLEQISNQTGYDFMFSTTTLKDAKNVNITVRNAALRDVLKQIFDQQPLQYEINAQAVVVSKKDPSYLDKIIARFQAIDVRGKILDEKGEPLVGATVYVKRSGKSVKTNAKGEFFLSNINETEKLIISYVGYQSREVDAASDMGSLTMTLTEAKLDEVMVNAGYYTVKDSERTGSISRITAKDIEKQPVTNVFAAMQGRMAGVSITQATGTPGGGFDIKIRGQNSIRSEGNSPLYIIDGVPYASDPIGAYQTATTYPEPTSPLNSINPDNIESIEILKDADATAIYGSRGANGVVLITTKKGMPGKARLKFDVARGVAKVTRFLKLMNTHDYLAMRKQAFTNDGLNEYNEWDYDINGTWDQNRYTDWQKELLGGTGETNALQGTVSGGSDNTQFLINGNYHSESTVLPGEFLYKKGGTQVNFNYRSTDQKFKVDFSANYILQNNNQPAFDFSYSARSLPPNAPAMYDADGNLNWENGTWQNPLANLYRKFESKTNDLVANAVFSFEVLPGLKLKSSFGYTDLTTVESRVMPSTAFNPIYNLSSAQSSISLNNTDRSSWIIEPQVNWDKESGLGKINVLLGTTFQNQTTNRLFQTGDGFTSNNLIYNLAAAQYVTVSYNDVAQYKYQAFFGRFNYNYGQRYIVNLTARRDGSSRFGPGKQFANFGAIGSAWLFSNEDFIKEYRWLSFGKLRASYGITGSDQIGDYQFLNTYTTSGVGYGGQIGLEPTRLYNPDFAWETNKKLEMALELGFLQDRIFFTGAWYKNRSSNQLVGIPLPTITGFAMLQSNLDATVQNTGLELTLRTDNFRKEQFTWSTSLNLTFSKNKLIRFPGLEGSSYSQKYRIGQPLNIQLLYQYKGINQQTGVYDFTDMNNDNIISFPEDKQSVNDLTPKYFGGIQNQLRFKRWSLDFLLQFVKQKNTLYPMGFGGQMSNQPRGMINSWQKAGDPGPFQILTTGNNGDAVYGDYLYYESDAAIVDASYIRLKNLSLTYDLPLILKKTQCKVSLQGQNLLTFTNYRDGDPEFMFYGFLPPLKVVTAGIQFIF